MRIEVRGTTQEGAAQMVAKGIWGPKRDEAAAEIAQKCKELGLGIHLKLAGTSSIEFNVEGVDKSLPIRFLQGAFEDVLKEMNYQPGSAHRQLVKPKQSLLLTGMARFMTARGLGFCRPWLKVRLGMLFALICRPAAYSCWFPAMILNRSFKRLVDALPKEVYCRVLVAANGGAELVYVNAKGQAVPVSGYRKQALDLAQDKSHQHVLDMVYIGDDGSKEGNDYPAFKAVGFKNSVLVARKFLADYDPALKPVTWADYCRAPANFWKIFYHRLTVFPYLLHCNKL